MKKYRSTLKENSCLGNLLFLLFIFHTSFLHSQNVAVNNTGSVPAASAMLDVNSSNKGVLLPRLTTAQRKAIVNPALGLLVFDIDKFSLYMFDGQNWMALSVKRMLTFYPYQGQPQIPARTRILDTVWPYPATMQL